MAALTDPVSVVEVRGADIDYSYSCVPTHTRWPRATDARLRVSDRRNSGIRHPADNSGSRKRDR